MDLGYYRNTRPDILRWIPDGTKRVLEVGCAAGEMGKALRELGVEELVGIEVVEEVARVGEKHYDRLFIGDVEKLVLPYAEGYFDALIYGDVIEHLVDPWRVVRDHARLLRSGGLLVLSIPNIRNYKVLKMLALRGEWTYQQHGIMDRTHLRFFTMKSIRSLLEEAAFDIRHVDRKVSAARWLRGANVLLGNALGDILAGQFVVVAVKRGE
ncbi:MAG: hypothetical protein FD129_1471 [bacterium]|nr:MAG: hypothetical protein FD129_1471 [bacterium]